MSSSNNTTKTIVEAIKSVSPYDLQEKNDISDILAWLQTTNDYCRLSKRPDYPDKHICVYIVALREVNIKYEFVLFNHKNSGLLLPAGGHLEVNETPYECAIREGLEELGLEIGYSELPIFVSQYDTGEQSGKHVELWYTVTVPAEFKFEDARDFTTEFGGYKWYTPEEVEAVENTTVNVKRFAQKAVERRSF